MKFLLWYRKVSGTFLTTENRALRLSQKAIFLFFLAVIILGTLQAAFNYMPDFLLISVVIAALFLPARAAMALGIFAGLFKDSFGASSFGINTVLFTFWSFSILKLNRKITFDNDLMRLALVFTAGFLQNTVNGALRLYLGTTIPPGIFLRITLASSAYNTLVFIPVLSLCRRFIFENRRFRY